MAKTLTTPQKPQIVFFGTGPVSLETLKGIAAHFDIEAIITKPDREVHGRPHAHPVKAWATEHDISVYQVANKAELSDLFTDKPFSSKVGLVVDFGIIINQDVIDYFPLGILNSHFSLLPLLRGADPISFAVLEGHDKTGVSVMIIAAGMDEGNLLAQEEYLMPLTITTPELTDVLTKLSNRMLIETIPQYVSGGLTLHLQNLAVTPTYSRKLTREDGVIDWTKPALQIEREIRAFLGWPGSRTELAGKEVIVTVAHVAPSPSSSIGSQALSITADKKTLQIKCGDGNHLTIDRLKPAGKKDMAAADFLRGLKA